MKKQVILLLVLLLICGQAAAELQMGQPRTGTILWPEGTDEQTAAYVYRYSWPEVLGGGELADTINESYTYLIEDAEAFTVPMGGEMLEDTEHQAVMTVTGEVTFLGERYLSVRVSSVLTQGDERQETIASHVFSLTGELAGRTVSLPQLLGLLKPGETDAWLEGRQIARVNDVVYDLVWQRILSGQAEPPVTEEELRGEFYPEEDFWLDEQGEPVFYLQPGVLAPEEEGAVTFTVTLEELEDEL